MTKTMIITGATSGIGFATFKYMYEKHKDYNFALVGRNIENLEQYATHSNVKIYKFSLNDLEDIPNLVDRIYKDFNSIDYLLNVAGYTQPSSLLETTLENLQITYNVNVFAPIILIRECVKFMKFKNSKILNVASTAGITPRPGWLSYASSKAAVVSINSTLSQELAEYGIKMYCISPGRCATALRRKLAPEEDQSKIMQPIDVAKVIYNLMDDDECCLDGQNIIVRKK